MIHVTDRSAGLVSEKQEFRDCKLALRVPFTTFHLNDQPPAVAAVTKGAAPVVLTDCGVDGLVVLLSADELERCDGNVQAMLDKMRERCAELGMAWPR